MGLARETMINIVIPVRNEAELIEKTLSVLEDKLSMKHKIIVVDDFSKDGTQEIVKKIISCNKSIELISNVFKQGFSGALKTGFQKADKNSVVVPVMGDFCDQPETINHMYTKITEGYDIICASRYMKEGRITGAKKLKNLASMLFNWIVYKITKIECSDLSNSFKMYKKEVLENISTESSGFEISAEIALKAYLRGYRITQVPTIWKNRETGKSKFNFLKHGSKYFKWVIFAIKLRL